MALLARNCLRSTVLRSFQKGVKNTRTLAVGSCCYAWKYVNTARYEIDDVNILKCDDPLSAKIVEKHGKSWHLFEEARHSSIAHTVSGDFDMYDGLAREFALNFKQTNQKELRNKKYPLGSVAVLKNGSHFIYYLVIRENWWDRGAYRPLRESLEEMRNHAIENNVCSITMGRLGAQADGLNFEEVLKDTKKVFYNTNVDLTVYARRT